MVEEGCKFSDLTPTWIKCPQCKKGELDPARGRFGPIYKCTNKACKFWLETRPTGKKCTYKRDAEKCGSLIVGGTKTIPDRCSDKTCPNRHPHKLAKAAADQKSK